MNGVQFEALSATQTLETQDLDKRMSMLKVEQEEHKRRLELEHQRHLAERQQKEEQLRLQLEKQREDTLRLIRVTSEQNAIKISVDKFIEGIANSTYMAKLHLMSDALSTTCDSCCKWVGNTSYYGKFNNWPFYKLLIPRSVCNSCTQGRFTLCNECYSSKTAFCWERSHRPGMKMLTVGDGPPSCRHTISPVEPELHLACYRCAKNIDGVFARKSFVHDRYPLLVAISY